MAATNTVCDAKGANPTQIGLPGGQFNLTDEILTALPFLEREDADLIGPFVLQALEMLVGEKLTDGMSDEKLDEFGYFVDQEEAGMVTWFAEHMPDYESHPDFAGLVSSQPEAERSALLSQFGAMRWLELNRPDYPTVTKECLERLLTTLQDTVIEAGSEGLNTWLRLRKTAWVWVFRDADSAEDVIARTAEVVGEEGPTAFAMWAKVQRSLDTLATHAADGQDA